VNQPKHKSFEANDREEEREDWGITRESKILVLVKDGRIWRFPRWGLSSDQVKQFMGDKVGKQGSREGTEKSKCFGGVELGQAVHHKSGMVSTACRIAVAWLRRDVDSFVKQEKCVNCCVLPQVLQSL